ncbi:MAG: proteasome subunit beta [Candidatus Marsarchaeota archaeon]|jgi:proteasome beta subunit|nr:proteasome subunit beta [Candidatus Marsarchaeota archaeon]MCL5419097.1 proteasome subunit beta [Candidatus Marsarchaeota archaeon]
MDNISYSKIMKGTTTVGMICSDGIVIGADTRATMDTFISTSEAKKVWKISDNLGMTIAGAVGDAQELIRIIKAQSDLYKMNEGRPMSPKAAASLLSIILQENKMMPFYVQLIVAGMDGDVPQLYDMDPLGGYTENTKFTATGSGSLTALGYIEDMYKKGLTTKEAVKGIARALSIAMRRDSATGDNMIIAAITKEGYAEYAGKDLEKALAGK